MSLHKTLIIAEAGVNHNGSLTLAFQLVEAAVNAGADIVKFQTFKSEHLVSQKAKKAAYQISNIQEEYSDSQYNMLKKLELSPENHYLLIDFCSQKNIQFLSTAFDLESLTFLQSLDLPFFKIPSGEITNLPYLRQIATCHKPIILSTGMANMFEIEQALQVLTSFGSNLGNITVLHCNTEYPTPFVDVNLKAMQTIRETFGVEVGYSDHTQGVEVAIAAVAMGATVIEKHFTLDRNMEGPDHKASLEPHELKAMISAIRNIEYAIGNGIKQPSPSEQKNILIARKSIHLASDLKQGHILTEADLVMKRPANGISPMLVDSIIGKQLGSALPAEHQLQLSDLL